MGVETAKEGVSAENRPIVEADEMKGERAYERTSFGSPCLL